MAVSTYSCTFNTIYLMYLLRILLNDLRITSLVSNIWLKSSYWIFRFTVFFVAPFLIFSITMNFKEALLNNLNISLSKSFLAVFLFPLLNSMCGFNVSFGSNFIALCIFLILTHASGKFVQFWFGLHSLFSFTFNILFCFLICWFFTPIDLFMYFYLLIW